MFSSNLFHNPSNFFNEWAQLSNSRQETVLDFLENKTKRFILGRNENSLILSKDIEFSGIVDDFITEPIEWHGMTVIPTNLMPSDAILVNTVATARPVSAQRRLAKLGEGRWLNHADLYKSFPQIFNLPVFVSESREVIHNECKSFVDLYKNLEDDLSRKTLLDIFHYRLTGCPSFMLNYECRMNDQYFESFYNFPKNGTFIDAGGFHGETSIEFSKRFLEYSNIYVFEPSTTNYSKILKNLEDVRNVQIYKTGLSSQKGTLSFSGNNGSASKISDNGTDSIEVDQLDAFQIPRIDFIKMDLEGWELHALQGSESSIRKYHPILAISAYHHPKDFIEIYNFIKSIRTDYKIYLRHYTEGWIETVLYFVPTTGN